jgi:hypothetical protein
MISIILTIILGGIYYLVNFLPTVSDTGVFTPAIIAVSGYITSIYAVFPLLTGTLLVILAFDIAFEVAYLLYKVIYWVIRRFPTQS